MIIPELAHPVTDAELKRLRELCEVAVKSGHLAITVVAQDVLRVITEFEQLRANWKKLEEINKG